MKYTVSSEANAKVERDMDVIVKEIRGRIPGVLSVILTGSFSRGEGPVKEVNGEFYPYNDYDVQVVIRGKIGKEEVDRISCEISKKLGYRGIGLFYDFKKEEQKMVGNFYLDLKVDSVKDLKKLLPRIRNYELRNESMLLWGRDYRRLIPDFSLRDVPLSDTAKLLLDRLSQLIQYYSVERKYDSEFLSYIIQQAYAVCCTSLLMLRGKYEIGYTRSMEIFKGCYKEDFPELFKKIPNLSEKIEGYINWKKNPIKLPFEDVRKEWFIAKRNLIEVAKYFFSEFLGRQIESVDGLVEGILGMHTRFYRPYLRVISRQRLGVDISYILLPVVSLVMKYKYYKRLREMGFSKAGVFFGKSPDMIIFASLIYIADSLKEGGVDGNGLRKGKSLLKGVYPVKGKDWEEVSLEYGNSYIGFFMQKI